MAFQLKEVKCLKCDRSGTLLHTSSTDEVWCGWCRERECMESVISRVQQARHDENKRKGHWWKP